MIAARHSLPPGGIFAHRDGLRTVHWPGSAAGTILFLGGRADFIEKYAESYWHWRGQGFAVASFDWRGQGGSGRLGRGNAGHADSFDPWLADLDREIAWVAAVLPPPLFVVTHSMGGHLLLRYLASGGRAPSRAVLLAPMLGLLARPLGPTTTGMLAAAAVQLGQAERYAPGQRDYDPDRRQKARQRLLTGDVARFDDEAWWLARHPELALGGVTYGWLHSAVMSLRALQAPGMLERIATPLLILLAGREGLVDNAAARVAAARLPAAKLDVVPGAAHELLRETDAVRLPVLAQIDQYLRP